MSSFVFDIINNYKERLEKVHSGGGDRKDKVKFEKWETVARGQRWQAIPEWQSLQI